LKIIWPPFQDGSTAFSKWFDRILKMGRPSFEKVEYRRKLSGTKRRLLKIFVPPNTAYLRELSSFKYCRADEAAQAATGEVNWAANLSMENEKNEKKTLRLLCHSPQIY